MTSSSLAHASHSSIHRALSVHHCRSSLPLISLLKTNLNHQRPHATTSRRLGSAFPVLLHPSFPRRLPCPSSLLPSACDKGFQPPPPPLFCCVEARGRGSEGERRCRRSWVGFACVGDLPTRKGFAVHLGRAVQADAVQSTNR